MTVPITGPSSVIDRTVFTNKGPIVKKPVSLLTGLNVYIANTKEVYIPTGSFDSTVIGKFLTISGSPSGRNDGNFLITELKSSTRLIVSNANFDTANYDQTIQRVVSLSNNLKAVFNQHINTFDVAPAVHGSPDTINEITFENAVDLDSAIILLNLLKLAFNSHILTVGPIPTVHAVHDDVNNILAPEADNLNSAIILANELRAKLDIHKNSLIYHQVRDVVNRITVDRVVVVTGSGPLIGPFTWTLKDPRSGQIADDPLDVTVRVNGIPVTVEYVFGLLGAIVLASKPNPTDTVDIDYSWIENPPTQFLKSNTFEYVLNESLARGTSGIPGHKYKARASLVATDDPRQLKSPFLPKVTGWKYKGIERAYLAGSNDPNLLLSNVPSSRIKYQVLDTVAKETVIRYDPTTLPNDASDPWTLNGVGDFTLATDNSELTINNPDSDTGVYPTMTPPFFSHKIDFTFPSNVSAAFRARVISYSPDGVFTGVGFGISDGYKTALVGFIETQANNLSSSIYLANKIKSSYNLHLSQIGVHRPDDVADAVDVVDAYDLNSAIILVNRIKTLYSSHLSKGAGTVHVISDVTNIITSPNADDLESLIILVNELTLKFNAHRVQSGIHYNNDNINSVGTCKQVGILKSNSFAELDTSWVSSAIDWTITTTYRIYKDKDGNYSLYVSGGILPIVKITRSELPDTAALSIKIDTSQQVIFGSVWRGATNISGWSFIRATTIPIDFTQIQDNKSVIYDVSTLPEMDVTYPWVVVGQGGSELILTGVPNKLMVDSSSSVPRSIDPELGQTTNEYRGYLRSEPILSTRTTLAIEFSAFLSYWTHSLDNKSAGVYIDDGAFSTYFCFLQHTPTPATITGTSTEPFPIAANDSAIISIGQSLPVEIVFPAPVVTAAQVVAQVNATLGFTFAYDDSGKVRFTDSTSGASSKIVMIGGEVLEKIGIAPGTYFGKDSNPEPKVSWYGAALPNEDLNPWVTSGNQIAEMFGRILKISDSSSIDYRSYTEIDPLIIQPVLNPSFDWKMDAKFTITSHTIGGAVSSGTNLRFCGLLINIDEGPSGKNVEVHSSVDYATGVPYFNILSYNSGTNNLDQITSFSFAWTDKKAHTINIFTSKGSDNCIFLVDGAVLGTFNYSSLNPGFSGPSITFGSGGEPVNNADLRSANSTIEWSSVSVFKDSKIADPLASSRRYIGIYGGGDTSLLSSYYLHQIDWTSNHVYRLVRDPVTGVSVYIDGSSIPSISVNYDSLKLPPSDSSFLKTVTDSRQAIAFGSFNSQEIDRSIWSNIRYSLGKMTITDRLVPRHQVFNQMNAYASPEHLKTTKEHQHYGFKVYSGGTPIDDFMSDSSVRSYTELGTKTPPVPMTQNLESRGGLVKTGVQISSVTPIEFVNTKGYISDLIDDIVNILTLTSPIDAITSNANNIGNLYNDHLTKLGVHATDDLTGFVPFTPATTLSSAYSILNAVVTSYNIHRTKPAIHTVNDTVNIVTAPMAVDPASYVALALDFAIAFQNHSLKVTPHAVSDTFNAVVSPNAIDLITLVSLANEIQIRYAAHRVHPGVHINNDLTNVVVSPPCSDLATAIVLLNEEKAVINQHMMFVIDNTNPLAAHKGIDIFDTVTVPDSTDLASAITLANAIKVSLNGHLVKQDSHIQLDYEAAHIDVSSIYTSNLVTLGSEYISYFRDQFNKHLTQSAVHVTNDLKNKIVFNDPTDLNTLCAATNLTKTRFNAHLISLATDSNSKIHTNNDVVNTVTAPNSTDFITVMNLIEELINSYNPHLVQPNVHGSTVFIKIDAPYRVRYQGTKFFKFESGEPDLTFPIDDHISPVMGPMASAGAHFFAYEGGSLPEYVNLVSGNYEPFNTVNGDTVILTIGSNTYTTVLQVGDTTVANIVSRINTSSSPAIPAGIVTNNGDGRIRITSPTVGVPVYVSGTATTVLGLSGSQSVNWFLISDDPSSVSVSLIAGPPDYLRYQTNAPGTETSYMVRTGLTDQPSVGYEAIFNVKISSFTLDSAGNTGIYFGLSGSTGIGYTAAIGFDVISGVKYVKVQDLKSGNVLLRKPFNWDDGSFHVFKLLRTVSPDTLTLIVMT